VRPAQFADGPLLDIMRPDLERALPRRGSTRLWKKLASGDGGEATRRKGRCPMVPARVSTRADRAAGGPATGGIARRRPRRGEDADRRHAAPASARSGGPPIAESVPTGIPRLPASWAVPASRSTRAQGRPRRLLVW